ncbi:MAG: DUF1232 domain-containing protein [Deltaproteobacteria bacterium]|nr:DUF1232 domain-containing protein [Deltaproteobacteria bacterium]
MKFQKSKTSQSPTNNKPLDKIRLWSRLLENFRLFLALVRDYCAGRYRKIPFLSTGIIVFTLFYILCPIDVVSDFIPVLGQLDDVTVLALCLYLVEKDLRDYKKWKTGPGS